MKITMMMVTGNDDGDDDGDGGGSAHSPTVKSQVISFTGLIRFTQKKIVTQHQVPWKDKWSPERWQLRRILKLEKREER